MFDTTQNIIGTALEDDAEKGIYRKGDNVEHPPEIVGERRQAELAAKLFQATHQERALVHPLSNPSFLLSVTVKLQEQ